MRDADGFSVQELRLLPEGVFRLLNLIFSHAENRKIWPTILTGFLTWKQVRPISIAQCSRCQEKAEALVLPAYARCIESQGVL